MGWMLLWFTLLIVGICVAWPHGLAWILVVILVMVLIGIVGVFFCFTDGAGTMMR